jgi:predicted ester cyclase
MRQKEKEDIVGNFYRCLINEEFEELKTLTEKNILINSSEIGVRTKSEGFESLTDSFCGYKTAFPDFRLEIKEVFVKDDLAVAYITITGTNTGGLFGFIGTETEVSFSGFEMFRFSVNNKISEITRTYDTCKLLKDLHLLEEEKLKFSDTLL